MPIGRRAWASPPWQLPPRPVCVPPRLSLTTYRSSHARSGQGLCLLRCPWCIAHSTGAPCGLGVSEQVHVRRQVPLLSCLRAAKGARSELIGHERGSQASFPPTGQHAAARWPWAGCRASRGVLVFISEQVEVTWPLELAEY